MIKRLRVKFVLINMTIVTMMLCVILGLVYYFTRADLETQSVQMMENVAVSPVKPEIPQKTEGRVHLPYFVFKMGNRGEMIAVQGGYYDLSNEEFLDELVNMTYDSHHRTGVLKKYNLRYCMVDTPPGRYLVFADMSSELATLDNLMRTSVFTGAVAFLIFFGISVFLSGWVVRPVEEALSRQQQFIADASHELKTPLTVVMTNAQILQEAECDPEQTKSFTDRILVMSRQMKGLVEEMLELARTDSCEAKKVFNKVDLSKLVSDSVLPFEPVFFEKGLTLETEVEDGIFVKGDEGQLRHLMEVLLDNAQKYSRDGGITWVNLKHHGKRHVLISVANQGDPIEKEQLEHMFKRFYRGDDARSCTGSYGLGLAIAKSVVEKHGGKIWMESENGINTCYITADRY